MQDTRTIEAIVPQNPWLSQILSQWQYINLPDCWLVAGAIAQTVWNHAGDLPLTHGIADIDLIYFDASDLSEASEYQHAERIRALFANLPVHLDVKNEARVHLWYAEKFGDALEAYQSSQHAIDTFPTIATSIGVRPNNIGGLHIYAPYGVADLINLVVRPNKKQIKQQTYEHKLIRWQSLWPYLTMMAWDSVAPTIEQII